MPSALNAKVNKFNEAQLNGGSRYDSYKVASCYGSPIGLEPVLAVA